MSDRDTAEKKQVTREYSENPYNPDGIKPEDVMRFFFVNDVDIVPVISGSGSLLGILKKKDLTSELSDIERVRRQKTDQFIQKLITKMSFDELLPHVAHNCDFVIINIFGESQGRWTRLQLLEACEESGALKNKKADTERQREDQALEWMIYLILEHIPRPLYAINSNDRTMFYNSHFEDLITQTLGTDFEIEKVEQSLCDPDKNDFYYNESEEILFYNQDFSFYYEKIPLLSRDHTVGFLIFCDKESNIPLTALTSKKNLKKQSLQDRLLTLEKITLTETIKEHNGNLDKAAFSLKISKNILRAKVKKFNIETGILGKGKKK